MSNSPDQPSGIELEDVELEEQKMDAIEMGKQQKPA
jgi:hypothetical protein